MITIYMNDTIEMFINSGMANKDLEVLIKSGTICETEKNQIKYLKIEE